MVGHKQSLGGDVAPGPIAATALATSTKNDTPVANFVNSQNYNKATKQQSHTLNQGCKFELNLKKSRLFYRTRKNSVDSNLNQLDPFLIAYLATRRILHISAVIPHFGYKYNNIIPHRTPKI